MALIILHLFVLVALSKADCPSGGIAGDIANIDDVAPEDIDDEHLHMDDFVGLEESYDDDDGLNALPSLKEIIKSTMAKDYDDMFTEEGKKASALAILNRFKVTTKIKPEYLTKLFYEKVGVESEEELEQKKYTLDEAMEFVNSIAQHFQDVPSNEGRLSSELEGSSAESTSESDAVVNEEQDKQDSDQTEPAASESQANDGAKTEL